VQYVEQCTMMLPNEISKPCEHIQNTYKTANLVEKIGICAVLQEQLDDVKESEFRGAVQPSAEPLSDGIYFVKCKKSTKTKL
jgi:hypothetical protein